MNIKNVLFFALAFLAAKTCDAENSSTCDAERAYLTARERALAVPSFIGYKKLKNKKGRVTHQKITYVQNDAKNHTTHILTEFRLISNNKAIGISKLEGPFGVWFFGSYRLIKASNDFIQENGFSVKKFNALPAHNSRFSIVSPGKYSDSDSIIIERNLSMEQREELRQLILRDYKFLAATIRASSMANVEKRILQDMPVRALFRVASSTGIIIEDLYFNEQGKMIGKLVDFDRIEMPKTLDASLFSLPIGKAVEFPKNSDETRALIRKLLP